MGILVNNMYDVQSYTVLFTEFEYILKIVGVVVIR